LYLPWVKLLARIFHFKSRQMIDANRQHGK